MIRRFSGMTLAVVIATACAQNSASQQPAPAPQVSKPAAGARAQTPYTKADVHFLAGMIGHHAQAIQMAGWAPSHGASPAVRVLCERIVVAQTDEIDFAQRWLRERGQFVPPADPRGHIMEGMAEPMLMPGMLTPEQMKQLDSARGTEFDRLFLTFMIQHHQGAIAMVDTLFKSYGAGQDDLVYKVASDVWADQMAEIERMQKMLAGNGNEPRP